MYSGKAKRTLGGKPAEPVVKGPGDFLAEAKGRAREARSMSKTMRKVSSLGKAMGHLKGAK